MDDSKSSIDSTDSASLGGEVAGTTWVQAGVLEERMPGIRARFGFGLTSMPDSSLSRLTAEILTREQSGNGRNGPGGSLRPLLLAQTHSTAIHDLSGSAQGSNGGNHGEDGKALFDGNGKSRLNFDGAAGTLSHPALLAVKTADCIPLLAVDPEREAYAALHAGWRGAAGGILPNLLRLWRKGGSSLVQVSILLGPHIQGCCFEVRDDCLSQFFPEDLQGAVLHNSRPGPPSRRLARSGLLEPPSRRGLLEDSTHLVLATVLRNQARRLGLEEAQVEIAAGAACTVCSRDAGGRPPYSSYRRTQRNGGGPPGTNLALIGPA